MIRSVRNLRRLLTIGRVLARHDALFLLEEYLPLTRHLSALLRGGKPPVGSGRPGQRLADALTELGPSFIKLGQALSTRADLLGEEMAADLSGLQDKLPPFPAYQARQIIEEELGGPIAQHYSSFASFT